LTAIREQGTFDQVFRGKKGRDKIAMLTAYDYPLARLLDENGIDLILVGDSLGMVILGYPDTTAVTIDDMVHHTRAVARGVTRAWVVADLPYKSYETTADALRHGYMLIEAGAHAVKLEGGIQEQEQIRSLVSAGIPVVAHIGMLPQHILEEGGYKIKGKSDPEIEALIEDGKAVERAGASAVVMELVRPGVAETITSILTIPTIGIGSGAGCDGQVLVTYDLVGFFPWFKPRFVTRKADVAGEIGSAVKSYIAEVKGEMTNAQ
jgi:3-methyl-2-oxobutanoate hydroxymethyltransferase